ncbi:MAG: peptidyl-prolyl cis-trans isomerase [Bryobacteraceae bacterium]
MFDLFRSRQKYVKYLMGGLLTVVALSMVITLVPGYGSGGGSRNDQVIAQIGGDSLTAQEAATTMQSAMKDRSIPPELAEMYVPMYVNRMIGERALAYQAKRMGLVVTDEELAETIRQMAPQLFQDGKVNRDLYAQMLGQQGMTIGGFEETMRKQLLLTKLQELVTQGAVVTDAEVQKDYHKLSDKVRIEFVALTQDKLKAQVSVTPDEIKKYFDQTKSMYTINEKRSVKVLSLDEATVAGKLTIGEPELRQLYESNKDRFRTTERVKVRHILVMTQGKPKEDAPKLKAKAEDLLKQIKAGADFAELAKKNSDDPSSAVNGGAMDWFTHGQMVGNFEKTAFALKPKEISGVVDTEFGYHIIQLLEREDARLKPFDEVKTSLAAEAQKQVVFDKLQSTVDQAQQAVLKAPQQADEIAQKFGLKVDAAEKLDRVDPMPGVGVNQEMAEAVFAGAKGTVTPVVQAVGNKLAFAVVTDITPSRPAQLAEVEGRVKDALIGQKTQKLFSDKVAQASARSRAVNGDMATLAKELGTEVKKPDAFTRAATVTDLGAASYVNNAFDAPVGTILGPTMYPDKTVFFKVVEKIPADAAGLAAQRDSIVQRLKSDKARERQEMLEDSVVAQLTKDGKVKINKEALARFVANYKRS